MQTAKPYTFTWAGNDGPELERFQTLIDLAAFLAGWCRNNPKTIQTVSIFDWRG
jgi:hypothetical protein